MIWHLGCGTHTRPLGFPGDKPVLNIDLRPLPHVDEVCDVRDLSTIVRQHGAPDKIAAEDVLEHLPRADARAALAHWCEILKPGGTLHLRVPDLQALAGDFVADRLAAEAFEQRLYGTQDYPENTHACGFTRAMLERLLHEQGFSVRPDAMDPQEANGNLWVYGCKPVAQTTADGPHVLIVAPWTAQGLTTMGVHLGRLLESIGCRVTYHAWQHARESKPRHEPPGWPEDDRVDRRPFGELDLSGVDVAVWLEVVEADQVAACNAHGIQTLWVPMWEFVDQPHPVDTWADWSTVVCPTRCCYDLLRKLGHPAHLVPWWCGFDRHDPRPTPPEPTFLHVVRGLGGDLRNTTAMLTAWREFRESGGRGKLIVKALAPLRTFVQSYEGPPTDCEVIETELPPAALAALYRRADVFVYPTKREGLGLTLLEALAAGLPVVTTDAPPMNEWVQNGVNGMLVSADVRRPGTHVPEHVVTAAALAATLRRITTDRIDAMKAHTHDGLDKRREAFRAFWANAISGIAPHPLPTAPPPVTVPPPAPLAPVATILTATHNRLDLTKRTVASVRAHTHTPHRWLFVDNGSTDGTVAWLRSEGFEVVAWPENRGKPAALNHAMQQVDTPWWVVLDNDVEVPDWWLGSAIETLKASPEIGILALSAETVDYPVVPANCHHKVEFKALGAVNGACQVARRELIDRIGYHSTAYGLGGYLDWEWALRVRLSGLAQGYLPGKRLVHLGTECSAFDQPKREAAGRLWHERSAAVVSGKLPLYIGADGQDTGPQLGGWPTPKRRRHAVVAAELLGHGRGGGTLTMMRLLDAVRARGADITYLYVTAVGPWPDWIEAVPVPHRTVTAYDRALRDLARKPDIIIGDSAHAPAYVADTAAALGVPLLTYVQFIRGLVRVPEGFAAADESPVPAEYHDLPGLAANRKSTAIVTNSAYTARLVCGLVGVEPSAIIHPPLEPSALTGPDAPPVPDRPYVLSCSGFNARGAKVFVELARRNPDQRFLMLAGGGRNQATVDAAAKVPNLRVRVDWVRDMGPVYAQARCVMVASDTTETFGRSAAEACTNGIPLVASHVGHMAQIVTPDAGVLVPRGADVDDWDRALRRALRLRPTPSNAWNQDHSERFADIVESLWT